MIQETHSLLPLASEGIDSDCTSSTSTDRDVCVNIERVVMGRAERPTVIARKVKSSLKLTKSKIPLNIGSHDTKVEIEDPNKTSTVPNGSNVAVLSNEKQTTVQR